MLAQLLVLNEPGANGTAEGRLNAYEPRALPAVRHGRSREPEHWPPLRSCAAGQPLQACPLSDVTAWRASPPEKDGGAAHGLQLHSGQKHSIKIKYVTKICSNIS